MLITLVTTECTKRGNVKITKIISDLRDAIVDLKKIVFFKILTCLLSSRSFGKEKRLTLLD